jgi:hypothetical protein
MGLNLQREPFIDWMVEAIRPSERVTFLKRLEKHIGRKVDPMVDWHIDDDAFPKVGSYTTYGIFVDCLEFVVRGDYGDRLDPEDDIELEALRTFRKELPAGRLQIPHAAHFLDTGASDTIFIPVLFDTPLAFGDRFVASLPGAIQALEAFAHALGFALESAPGSEFEDGRWLAVVTSKNVARTLYGFFTEKQGACVVFA